jgi:hypothetical protein
MKIDDACAAIELARLLVSPVVGITFVLFLLYVLRAFSFLLTSMTIGAEVVEWRDELSLNNC